MPDENAKTYNSIFGRHLLVIDDDKNKLSIWMQIKFFYRNHCRCSLKVYSACLRMYVILFLLFFSDLCSSPSLENVIETVKKRESTLVSEYRYRIYPAWTKLSLSRRNVHNQNGESTGPLETSLVPPRSSLRSSSLKKLLKYLCL